jgi:hypothetical protein
MMEAVQTSKTSVNSYQPKGRYNPEDGHLHSHRREDLKSYRISDYFPVDVSFRVSEYGERETDASMNAKCEERGMFQSEDSVPTDV